MKNTCNCNQTIPKVTEFLKIINEPNRLKILCLLKNQEQCVCEICDCLELPQNLTSHHLKTLKEFGLLKSRQEGRKIIYERNQQTTQKYTTLLNKFLATNL